jgi:hypothetical protein
MLVYVIVAIIFGHKKVAPAFPHAFIISPVIKYLNIWHRILFIGFEILTAVVKELCLLGSNAM